jgi:hypothetical protein
MPVNFSPPETANLCEICADSDTKIGGEDLRAAEMCVCFGSLIDASQYQWWDEGHRGERRRGQTVWGPIGSDRRDHRDAGSEVAQNTAEERFVYWHV